MNRHEDVAANRLRGPFFGYFQHPPKQAQTNAWECPRCGRINAWWVASCRCKPAPKGPRRGY